MNNPPAFPGKQKALLIKSEHSGIAKEYEIDQNGMTLRDYFAAKATEQDIKNYEQDDGKEISGTDSLGGEWKRREIIYYTREQAKFRYADAMLKAREA